MRPRKNCGPVLKPIENRNSRKKRLLDLVRHVNAQLTDRDAGEERAGDGAERKPSQLQLSQQVAEAEHQEERDFRMTPKDADEKFAHDQRFSNHAVRCRGRRSFL